MPANRTDESEREGILLVQGRAQFEELQSLPSDLKVVARVIDSKGRQLGEGGIDSGGNFKFAVKGKAPFDGEIVFAPAGERKIARDSTLYQQEFSRADWQGEVSFTLDRSVFLPKYIWWPWWPKKICVSGHVRKISVGTDGVDICPVPFVKVEVFDVDREACWWPPIINRWDKLIDKLVVRAEDLLPPRPFPPDPGPLRRPIPIPDPSPIAFFERRSRFEQVGLNPQPLPPREINVNLINSLAGLGNQFNLVGFDPQPEPPGNLCAPDFNLQTDSPQTLTTRSLSLRQPAQTTSALSPALSARLQKLTITSKLAPWLIFPGCFYSKAEVCETTTDCNGYFECCFTWFPWHIRKGRLRFDATPDIILKVTQIIGGVETVIYLDPYTSTRWNVNNAHIDLYLDDPQVRCGDGCQPQPDGPITFLTLVGQDEVYKIDQVNGKFSNLAYGGGLSNWAYGGNLLICGLFGAALSTGAAEALLSSVIP